MSRIKDFLALTLLRVARVLGVVDNLVARTEVVAAVRRGCADGSISPEEGVGLAVNLIEVSESYPAESFRVLVERISQSDRIATELAGRKSVLRKVISTPTSVDELFSSQVFSWRLLQDPAVHRIIAKSRKTVSRILSLSKHCFLYSDQLDTISNELSASTIPSLAISSERKKRVFASIFSNESVRSAIVGDRLFVELVRSRFANGEQFVPISAQISPEQLRWILAAEVSALGGTLCEAWVSDMYAKGALRDCLNSDSFVQKNGQSLATFYVGQISSLCSGGLFDSNCLIDLLTVFTNADSQTQDEFNRFVLNLISEDCADASLRSLLIPSLYRELAQSLILGKGGSAVTVFRDALELTEGWVLVGRNERKNQSGNLIYYFDNGSPREVSFLFSRLLCILRQVVLVRSGSDFEAWTAFLRREGAVLLLNGELKEPQSDALRLVSGESNAGFDVCYQTVTYDLEAKRRLVDRLLSDDEGKHLFTSRFVDLLSSPGDFDSWSNLEKEFCMKGLVAWVGPRLLDRENDSRVLRRFSKDEDVSALVEYLAEVSSRRQSAWRRFYDHMDAGEFTDLVKTDLSKLSALASDHGVFEAFIKADGVIKKLLEDKRIRRFGLSKSLSEGGVWYKTEYIVGRFRYFLSQCLPWLELDQKMKRRIIHSEDLLVDGRMSLSDALCSVCFEDDFLCLKKARLYFPDRSAALVLIEEILVNEDYYVSDLDGEGVILDCGSHFGMSVYYYRMRYPEMRIVCFEPSPRAVKVLRKNVEENGWDNVEIVNAALASESSYGRFVEKGSESMAGSLDLSGALGDEVGVKVKTVKLSEYVDGGIDFLKLDVEGAEYEVLKDLVSKMENIRTIFCEYHEATCPVELDVVVELLKKSGFKIKVSTSEYYERIGRKRPFEQIERNFSYTIFGKREL